MKVLHVTYCFGPDPVGGTEVYVDGLCRSLERLGIRTAVAAPGRVDAAYTFDGVAVRRFEIARAPDSLEALYGKGDLTAARAFERLLDAERPDLVHQHAVSPACSVELMRRARRRGLPVVFTYHTPTASCQRGTLLRWGYEICDGNLRTAPCEACTLHAHGVPWMTAAIVARVPRPVGTALGRIGLSGGFWTAARMSALMDIQRSSASALFELPDRIVALSPWVRALLEANGVPDDKIVVSPHGIPVPKASPGLVTANPSGRVRIVHLGRLDPVKGTGLLIRALRLVPEEPIDLDVFGIVQDRADADVLGEVRRLADGDARITFVPPIEHSAVVARLADYDLLAVPSQWFETGPLVVLEAFAAGIPVLGSALGGILDNVADGVDGLLVRPHDSLDAWALALKRCAGDPPFLQRLRRGVRRPRSIADVAADMAAVYRSLATGADRGPAAAGSFRPQAGVKAGP